MVQSDDMKQITDTFTNVSLEIFSQMTRLSIRQGEISVKEHSYPSYDCSFIIGVTGCFKGAVTMTLRKETALFLASAMLGSTAREIDELAESALKELVNITVGQALSVSGSEGPLDITPPTFIQGTNISMSVADIQQVYVSTLITEGGPVEFTVSLEKS